MFLNELYQIFKNVGSKTGFVNLIGLFQNTVIFLEKEISDPAVRSKVVDCLINLLESTKEDNAPPA